MSKNLIIVLVNVIIECFLHDADKAEKTSTSQLLNFLMPDFVVSILVTSYIKVSR